MNLQGDNSSTRYLVGVFRSGVLALAFPIVALPIMSFLEIHTHSDYGNEIRIAVITTFTILETGLGFTGILIWNKDPAPKPIYGAIFNLFGIFIGLLLPATALFGVCPIIVLR